VFKVGEPVTARQDFGGWARTGVSSGCRGTVTAVNGTTLTVRWLTSSGETLSETAYEHEVL
jgi:hypothetical protein